MVKVVLTGSIGHIGRPLAQLLVKSGHSVSVITSSTERIKDIEGLGAAALVGSIEDPTFLASAFAGADVVYIMMPPKYTEPDNNAYYRRVADSAVQGIRSANVKKVILLSSLGADLSHGTGFILGSYHAEQILGAVEGISLTVIRPGYFYLNLPKFFKGMIQRMGFMGSNYGGADRMDFAHTDDIAEAIAEEVVAPAEAGIKVRHVVSDQRTCNEVASVLGAAINKPDLKWVTFTDEQTLQGALQSGMPPAAAALAVELGACMHAGTLASHFDSQSENKLGKVKLEEYVQKEFLPAYNA